MLSHRFAPGVNPNQRLDRWKKSLRALSQGGVHLGLMTKKHNPAFRQQASRPLTRRVQSLLKQMRRSNQLFLKPGCTEASYWAQTGCDVLTIGPGKAYGNVHQPNESIRIKELEQAVVFYKKVIAQLCM